MVLAALLVAAESTVLVSRASQGKSDVSVLIRSAILLNEGAGAEFYEGRDEVTGWHRAHPPAALALFQPLVRMGPRGAGIGWALANIGFLLLSLWSLDRFILSLGPGVRVFQDTLPWLAVLLMILAAGSIQVGQFSLLFVSCWIFALEKFSRQKDGIGGLAFALPIAIKLYPALLLAALGVLKPKRMARILIILFVGLLGFTVLLPVLSLGGRAGPLTTSWMANSLLGADGRISSYVAGPGPVSTQSIVSLLLRFLTGGSAFHAKHPLIPHLNLDPTLVLTLAAGICLAILSVSAWATLKLRQAPIELPIKLLYSAALWSATLYAVLPETKARYAVYAFLAFVPLVGQTYRAYVMADKSGVLRGCATIGFCLVTVMQAVPGPFQTLGVGYLGSLVLWTWNARWTLNQAGSEGEPQVGLPALSLVPRPPLTREADAEI